MANPAFQELTVKSLQELKAFRKPPPVVQLVMECVLLLEPMPTGGATGWRAALKLLTKPQAFMAALQDYPTGQPRVPTESLSRCRELLSTVDASAVKKVSIAAVGLYHWAQYVVDSASAPSIAVAPRAAPTSPTRVRPESPRVMPSKPTTYVSGSRPPQFAPPSRVPLQQGVPPGPGQAYSGQYPSQYSQQPLRTAQAQPQGTYAPRSQPPQQMPAFPGAGMMRPGMAPAPFPQPPQGLAPPQPLGQPPLGQPPLGQPLGFGGSPFGAPGFGMPGAFHPGFGY